jgi:hypothetical protein
VSFCEKLANQALQLTRSTPDALERADLAAERACSAGPVSLVINGTDATGKTLSEVGPLDPREVGRWL